MRRSTLALGLMAGYYVLLAQDGENVLLVVNRANTLSRRIADYYISKRGIPLKNVCKLDMPADKEEIRWDTYVAQVEQPIARCLAKANLGEQVLYIVTTMGVPLKVIGGGQELASESCAVDSELTLLYSKMQGKRFPRAGPVPNPFYRQKEQPFTHARFPIYLVTRLAGYDFDDVKGIVDRRSPPAIGASSSSTSGPPTMPNQGRRLAADGGTGAAQGACCCRRIPQGAHRRKGCDRLRRLGLQRSQSGSGFPRGLGYRPAGVRALRQAWWPASGTDCGNTWHEFALVDSAPGRSN